MDARCTSPSMSNTPPPAPQKSTSSAGRLLYRLSLVLFGLAWVFMASTLCGCSAANGWVMNRSGQAYYDRGDYVAARHEFERALMDSPNNPNYAFNVAQAMEQEGDLQGAEQMYQHALNLDPSHQPSYHALSAMLVDEGRPEDARALLSAWAETQPYLPESQLALAEMYETDGNYLAAQQYTQRALAMKPNDSRAMQRMGRIYQRSGNPRLAQQWYQQSLFMNPYQPNVRAQAQSVYGPAMSPAQHMAATMPRHDPSFAGGFQFTQPGFVPNTYLNGPTPLPQPQVMNGSTGWVPTGNTMNTPMTNTPMMSQTFPMQPSMMMSQIPETIEGTTVYESNPIYNDISFSGSETMTYDGMPVSSAPLVSSVPAVKAF